MAFKAFCGFSDKIQGTGYVCHWKDTYGTLEPKGVPILDFCRYADIGDCRYADISQIQKKKKKKKINADI